MTTKQSLLGLLIVSAVAASACGGGSSDQPTPSPAPAGAPAAVPAPEPQPTAPPAFTRTDLDVGTGREARAGNRISVHYTGWLYDPTQAEQKGRTFDSSVERGQPFTFTLGAGQVIPGWDQGFVGMKVGGTRRLAIPPDLAYGESGFGGGLIPPNSALIFEMKLLDVTP